MFGTIRRHQTWLWVVIIIVISLSMIVFFSVDPRGMGARDRTASGEYGSINGKPITHAEFLDAYKETRLSEFLRSGKWPGNEESTSRMLERQTANRVYLLHKLRMMDIEASDKAVGLIVQDQIRDYDYGNFERDILRPNGLTAVDYERFVRNDAGIRQLVAAAAVSSRLINPKEAEEIWRKQNQELKVKVAYFSVSNYLDKVALTNGALERYYTNSQGAYRLPERTVISYLAFAASNHLAEAEQMMSQRTNITDMVNEYYFRGGTNVWKDTNGVPLAEAAAKEKIREEIRLDFARVAARRAAAEFGTDLMNQPEPNSLATLESLAARNKLSLRTTQPFDRVSGLDEFAHEHVPFSRGEEDEEATFVGTLREKALALTPEKPILFNAIPGSDAVYLIALKAKIPSELQSFDTVRNKLTNDYRNYVASEMLKAAGSSFHTNLTNGLALKKSFDDLAAAAGVTVIDVPPFSLSENLATNIDSRLNPRLVQGFAARLEVGQASQFVPQLNVGEIVYLAGRPPIDEKKMAAELDEFIGVLRQNRQGEAFNDWFRREAEKDRLVIPQRESSVGAAN